MSFLLNQSHSHLQHKLNPQLQYDLCTAAPNPLKENQEVGGGGVG